MYPRVQVAILFERLPFVSTDSEGERVATFARGIVGEHEITVAVGAEERLRVWVREATRAWETPSASFVMGGGLIEKAHTRAEELQYGTVAGLCDAVLDQLSWTVPCVQCGHMEHVSILHASSLH